jgi:hypothetical protein
MVMLSPRARRTKFYSLSCEQADFLSHCLSVALFPAFAML